MNKCFVSILTPIVAAAHVRDGIRINVVCPGPIVTPMLPTRGSHRTDRKPFGNSKFPFEVRFSGDGTKPTIVPVGDTS
jgi:NAD(P)-dependent dehydrogenase (short-subunit alcohol dehydrogenase family)